MGGRAFTVGDTMGTPGVAIVNELLAQRYFGTAQALGHRLWLPATGSTPERAVTIVGIARNDRERDLLSDPEPVVYLAYPQYGYTSGSSLVVATTIDPAAAVPHLYQWLRQYEPHLAIVNAIAYRDVKRGFLYVQRMNAELFTTLAVLAVVLAVAGLFSVVSLAVGRRRREIAIRMAIGASRGDIGRLILTRAMTPVIAGMGIGVAGSMAMTGLVRSLLYGVEPTDPIALVGGAGVLVSAALVAAWIPTRRATRVEPMVALRSE